MGWVFCIRDMVGEEKNVRNCRGKECLIKILWCKYLRKLLKKYKEREEGEEGGGEIFVRGIGIVLKDFKTEFRVFAPNLIFNNFKTSLILFSPPHILH